LHYLHAHRTLPLRSRYDNRMSDESDSQEYRNFANLLRRIVTAPRAEVQKRMEEDEMTKDWVKANDQPQHRQRPIVSPDSVASSKIRS
jgi:hypothetical protein